MDDDEEFLTVAEVAKVLRYGRRTIREKIRDGEIPGRKYGRDYRVNAREFAEYLRDPDGWAATHAAAPADEEPSPLALGAALAPALP